MTKYMIFIRSNEHPRTINTPMMGRTYYTSVHVEGREAMEQKVAELKHNGFDVYEISTYLGERIYL